MDIVKDLKKLWDKDQSYKKLEWIEFNEVGIRGIKNIKITFQYPITIIAGQNGIGKTTLLQTIACLFHNEDTNYKPYRFSNAKNQPPYYRFSDFFVFTRDEIKFQQGIEINYLFNKKKYKISRQNRWSEYKRRPHRVIDYIGISRVLPSYEFSTFKNTFKGNYNSFNTIILDKNDKDKISNILNKPLEKIEEISSKSIINFKLNNIQTENGVKYSSFNMGAGEEVTIALISRIANLPNNSLVLIEEIELGLHSLAQKKLLKELMKIAKNNKLQIILTTHSPFIFKELPKEAKVLLRKKQDKNSDIEILYGASESITFIELTGESKQDLIIYVEDEIAKYIIEKLFNYEVMKRIRLVDVGDKDNVIKMFSAHIHNKEFGKVFAIVDGDVSDAEIRKSCKKYCRISDSDTEKYITNILKLPGELAPEKYIIHKMQRDSEFIKQIDDSYSFENFIKTLDLEDHHNLFFEIAKFLNKNEEFIKNDIIRVFIQRNISEFEIIEKRIKEELQIK